MKILVVEDSATLRHAISGYVRRAGHSPIFAKSGEEALQIVDDTPVDLIIMDVEMPGLDGFETTRLIREWLGGHWIPIIFVTGKSDEEDLLEGISAGGDDYLIKPVSPVILQAKINAMERITEMRDELAKLNRELTQLSQVDGLTQLLNRRTFESKAPEQWRRATRHKEPLSILLMDVDHFKSYNDCYGHQAGDECLKQIAQVLAECVNRPGDLVARYGGEEFIALLGNTAEAGATCVGNRICERVRGLNIKHRGSTTDTRVTVSVGASVVNFTTGTTLTKQINRADKALYASKQNGRNRCTVETFNPHSTILLIDDDNDTQERVGELLRGHCTLVTASPGDDCLQIARDTRPDVILLDIYARGFNGADLCKKLRDNPVTAVIPVILISGCDPRLLRQVAREVEAAGHLHKPADLHRLIATIDQFLV